MSSRRVRLVGCLLTIVLLASVTLATPSAARTTTEPAVQSVARDGSPAAPRSQGPFDPNSDGRAKGPAASNRLIVELKSAPLSVWARSSSSPSLLKADGRLNVEAATAQAYIGLLRGEQAAFVQAMRGAVPGASVSAFTNELGVREAA